MTNVRNSKITSVTAANKSRMPVQVQGDILLRQRGTKRKIILKRVLYVPNITCNLLSVSAIVKSGHLVSFRNNKCLVTKSDGTVVLEGVLSANNVYKLNLQVCTVKDQELCSTDVAFKATVRHSISLWHRRLAHLNDAYLKQLTHSATGIQFDDKHLDKCQICVADKLTSKTFTRSDKRATSKLQLVHSDVFQVSEPSIEQTKYFVTFLDDHTRKIFVYFMKRKDEVPDIVKKFILYAERQPELKIKVLRTDNGREYVNSTLSRTLEELGVRHETSIAYQPQ